MTPSRTIRRPAGQGAARRVAQGRAGMTLMELMIAVAMLVLLFAAAVPLFQSQSRLLSRQAGRGNALQAARFVGATLERELRISGPPNQIEEQPLLVQAHPYALTVNVDLNSRDTTSASAVYFDPDIDIRETQALTPARAVVLPRGGGSYPRADYVNPAGIRSDAETISYWLSRDQTVARTDVHTLWRRINDGDSTAVARNLVIRGTRPFFEYMQAGPGDTLRAIAAARLPAYHTVPLHGSVTDVGATALVDSVREVRVLAEVLYRDPHLGDTTYVSRFGFRLLNAGLIRRNTCGTPPRSVLLTATAQPNGIVRLTWPRSVDDGTGELDVRRYALYRRKVPATDWGEPFLGVRASGLLNYVADDVEAKPAGERWEYSATAQDCTPTNSTRALAPTVTIQ